MSITDAKKIDYLWKKVGYGVTKTDTNATKKAPNEAIASPLLNRGDTTWNQSNIIDSVMPSSNTSVTTVYPTSSPAEAVADATATLNRTWKTELTDWIPPEFGSTYQVKVYIHDSGDAPNAVSSGTQVFATGSGNNDEWFFDYQSGVLHFIGTNLPNGVNFNGKSVYVSGARYTGTKGLHNLLEGGSSGGAGGGENTAVSQFSYYKVGTGGSIIDEYDASEFAGGVYYIAVEDIENNLNGYYTVALTSPPVFDTTTSNISVYNIYEEDSTAMLEFSVNDYPAENAVKLTATSLNSEHLDLKIYRIFLGPHHSDASSTNSNILYHEMVGGDTQKISSFNRNDHGSAKFVLTFNDPISGHSETQEVLVYHDYNGTAYLNSYGVVSTGSDLATLSVIRLGNEIQLRAQSRNGNPLTIIGYSILLGEKTKIGTFDDVVYGKTSSLDSTVRTLDRFSFYKKKVAKYIVHTHNSNTNSTQTYEILLSHNGSDDDIMTITRIDANEETVSFSTTIDNGIVKLRVSAYEIGTTVYFARFDYASDDIYKSSGSDDVFVNSNTGLVLPVGTTAQRPTAQKGILRFNSTTSKYEVSEDGETFVQLRTDSPATLTKDVFTGDGTTSTFTMTVEPSDVKSIVVYIDGVMQEPDNSYTISGTDLVISEPVHQNGRIVVMHGFAD